MKKTGVSTTHDTYNSMNDIWSKCADASEGEIAVHAAGAKYLPLLEGEKQSAYLARKNRTPFFNATWRTISGLKGMIFRKDPVRELPAAIEPYLDDVDLAGTPLDAFTQKLVEEVLTFGRACVLVDYPNTITEGLTVAQAEALNLRPMLQMYSATNLINWRTARVNGRTQLTLAVLKEIADVHEDDFVNETEERYRVLDLIEGVYRQRVFKIVDGNDVQITPDIFPQMNGKPLDYIPLVIYGVDQLGATVASPPLLDLINMNFKHYTVSADYEHGCHFSGLPTLFVFGVAPDKDSKIYLGGPSANCISNPQGKAEYAQVQGGFEALQHNLESKERQMAVLGARMLEQQKNAVESAETQQQRIIGESSQLAAMANLISMGMEKCLKIFAEWSGAKTSTVKYQLNTDYVSSKLTAQELTSLVASWQAGAISQQVMFDNMQKGEIISAETTFEEEQERISSQALPGAMIEPMDEDDEDDQKPVAQPNNMDMAGVIAAIQAIPAPVVNVAAPVINVPAAIVNIPEQPAPNITVNSPPVTVTPGAVTVINSDSAKDIKINYDDAGNITGGNFPAVTRIEYDLQR